MRTQESISEQEKERKTELLSDCCFGRTFRGGNGQDSSLQVMFSMSYTDEKRQGGALVSK